MSTIVADRLVENYYRFMKYWDIESKKNIIRKLTVSITSNTKTHTDFSTCFGAWDDTRSSEEIIAEIRADRVNQKEIEGF